MAVKSPTALMGLEHYVYRRDGKVYVYRVGDGDPIVFLHSVGTHGASWKRIVDELSLHFACYVIDMPGHDHSDIPPRKYTLDDYADAVVDVMDAIGLEQANIMGDHTGAMISAIVAVQHPERVKRLVLDGLPYWNKEQGQIIWERWFSPMYSDTTSYHIPVIPLTTWEEAKAKNPALDKEDWETRDALSRKSRLWWRWSQEANSGYDIAAIGSKIKAPTLLLFGDGDTLRRTEKLAHEDIKGSVHKVIPDCQGQITRYQPAALIKEALAFLKGG